MAEPVTFSKEAQSKYVDGLLACRRRLFEQALKDPRATALFRSRFGDDWIDEVRDHVGEEDDDSVS